MKRIIWFLQVVVIFPVLITQAQVSEQAPLNLTLNMNSYQPTQADIKAIMGQANHKLSSVSRIGAKDDCKIDYDISREINLERDYVCMAPPKKTFSEWMFDPEDKITYEGVVANDANLLRLRDENKPGAKLSNDTGYTLGTQGKYSRENAERIWSFEMDSKLYTAYTKGPNGKTRSAEGKYYLDTYEVSRLNFNIEDKRRNDGLRAVGQVGLRMDSDDANGLAANLQDNWHNNLDRYKTLQYEKIPGGYSKMTLEVQAGFKKVLESDISNLKCMAAGTVMVGMDSSGRPLLTTKLEAQATSGTMGGRDASTPLLVIKVLQDINRAGSEVTRDERFEVGSYLLAQKNISVYAGLGRGRHVTNAATRIPKDKEPIQYIVLRAEKKFK